MSFKKYLMSLRWNTFERYPRQGELIYIHCTSNADEHKFLKVHEFNAISFDHRQLISKLTQKQSWQMYWLPASQIKEQ